MKRKPRTREERREAKRRETARRRCLIECGIRAPPPIAGASPPIPRDNAPRSDDAPPESGVREMRLSLVETIRRVAQVEKITPRQASSQQEEEIARDIAQQLSDLCEKRVVTREDLALLAYEPTPEGFWRWLCRRDPTRQQRGLIWRIRLWTRPAGVTKFAAEASAWLFHSNGVPSSLLYAVWPHMMREFRRFGIYVNRGIEDVEFMKEVRRRSQRVAA